MKLIVANWKCNPTNLKKARKLFYSAKRGVKNIKNLEVVICPPFVWLSAFSFQLSANLKLGAQDCFWQEGAFTGEVSARMLKDLGVDYVIVGHSERRKYFSETDEMINKKLKSALKAKLKPILCIGETEKERKRGKTSRVLKNQLKKALKNLTIGQFNNLTIAYEPVWAIGTGNPCSPEDAKKALIFLKKITHQLINSSTHLLFLYGGSVNSKNAKDYIKVGFDGLLVGGASLNSREFIEIVKSCIF